VSRAEIEAARTPRGGWTRETLAGWGIPWPPPPGWRKRLLGEGFDKVAYQREYMRRRRAAQKHAPCGDTGDQGKGLHDQN